MATIIKPVFWGETWNWKDNHFVRGDTVKCDVYSYRGEDRSFVSGTIEPWENHGYTTAASDYYYLITEGSCEVYIGKDGCHIDDMPLELAKTAEFKAGESFLIKAGTIYNYRAGENGLSFVLFMNNLWEEKEEEDE